jgi:hypothetical protein
MFGFRFRESMAGTWTPEGGGPEGTRERPISFALTARARSWLQHLRDHGTEVDGTLRMEGFAREAPVRGSLYINPILEGVIRYQLEFTGDDGRPYRLKGQKDVSVVDLVGTLTTLPATVEDEHGKVVARARLKFDTRDLPGFLSSFRPG